MFRLKESILKNKVQWTLSNVSSQVGSKKGVMFITDKYVI